MLKRNVSSTVPDTLIKTIVGIYTKNKILIKFNSKLLTLAEINKADRQDFSLLATRSVYLDGIIL
jgi:hypothetical protein